jgi:hypothetical protein
MDWWELPHEKLQRVEVYFDRTNRPKPQPVISITRDEGADVRFFQFKFSGVVAQACGDNKELPGPGELYRLGVPTGQARLGVRGYFMGYWNRKGGFAEMIKVERDVPGWIRFEPVAHPCWPKPHGYGLAPYVVGLTPEQVPAMNDGIGEQSMAAK